MKTVFLIAFLFTNSISAAELAKPSFRDLLTVILSEKSKSEADGITRFVSDKKINLDSPVALTIKHKMVWLSGREVKFTAQNQNFSFNGVNFKNDSSKPFDVAVEDAFKRLRPGQANFSLFVTPANAADTNTDSAMQALILGWATSSSPTPSFWLTASQTLSHAVGVALASTFLPQTASAHEPIRITLATCDSKGLRIETSEKKTIEGKLLPNGTVEFKVNGAVAQTSEKGSIATEISKSSAHLVAQCTSNPFKPGPFKIALQNSLDKKLHSDVFAQAPTKESTPATR